MFDLLIPTLILIQIVLASSLVLLIHWKNTEEINGSLKKHKFIK